MLNWFLDLGLGVFIDICAFTIVILGVFMVIKKSYAFMLIQTIFFLCFFTPIITLTSIMFDDKTFDLKQKYYTSFMLQSSVNITFGEAWCVYKDYTGELCKDYTVYVLDKQNIAEQEKRKIELEKQQKLDKETLRKNKILTNYEKLIEEIKKNEKDKK